MTVPESHLHFILLVDIEDFSLRPDSVQKILHDDVYAAVRSGLQRAGFVPEPSSISDRGDGMLILLPPTLSPPVLLRELLRGLDDALVDHHHARSEGYRMRLRAGLQSGLVSQDGQRWTGSAINDLARLVDADHVKRTLKAAAGAHLAFVLPDSLYAGVVQGRHTGIDPAAYSSFDFVTKHHEDRRGWITVPGHPTAPTGRPDGADRPGTPPQAAGTGDNGDTGLRISNSGTNHGNIVQGTNVHGNKLG